MTTLINETILPDVSAELHTSVTQFYAHHMQMLDDGRVQEWAELFTPDGVFAADGHPEPAVGRGTIIKGATFTVAKLAQEGISRRHWLGMSAITPLADGTVKVRSYAIVYQITAADGAAVRSSTTCEDILVPAGTSWLIKHRQVSQDLPA